MFMSASSTTEVGLMIFLTQLAACLYHDSVMNTDRVRGKVVPIKLSRDVISFCLSFVHTRRCGDFLSFFFVCNNNAFSLYFLLLIIP